MTGFERQSTIQQPESNQRCRKYDNSNSRERPTRRRLELEMNLCGVDADAGRRTPGSRHVDARIRQRLPRRRQNMPTSRHVDGEAVGGTNRREERAGLVEDVTNG